MRKHMYKLGLVGMTLAFVVASGSTALALPSYDNSYGRPTSTTASTDHTTDATKETRSQERLPEARLKICRTRQRVITNTMTRIANRGQKHLKLFETIASRVEAFYTKKGKTLSNYDALAADVSTKQMAAQTTVDKIAADATSFHCDGANPKGVISLFKSDLKAEISALHEYRKSVRNLTVGVKSVQVTAAGQEGNGGNQ